MYEETYMLAAYEIVRNNIVPNVSRPSFLQSQLRVAIILLFEFQFDLATSTAIASS